MIPGTKEYMLRSGYWIRKMKEPEKLIMTEKEISEFNRGTFDKVKFMVRLDEYRDCLSREELLKIIQNYRFSEKTRYDMNGKVADREFYDPIEDNVNLSAISENNQVRFGIAVKSTRVRSFPTDEGCFDDPDDVEFDLFQETECQAIEPVAILHTSKDGEWFFIQMYNYNGWVRKEDIAVGKTKKEIFDYLGSDKFLMVTGNKITTQFNHYDSRISKKDFYMGTRIPLSKQFGEEIGHQTTSYNYVATLPVRDDNGELELKDAVISFMEDVSAGYLPYTRTNLLKQAFKLQGDRYDWGNKNNGRDCSSFVMTVYKTCGIILPRNGDHQEMGEGIFIKIDEKASIEERIKLFEGVKPGTEIFMDGHVMMYIGEDNGEHFMIHDFYRYGMIDGGELKIFYANEIAVTSIMLLTAKGKKFIETFTALGQFERGV